MKYGAAWGGTSSAGGRVRLFRLVRAPHSVQPGYARVLTCTTFIMEGSTTLTTLTFSNAPYLGRGKISSASALLVSVSDTNSHTNGTRPLAACIYQTTVCQAHAGKQQPRNTEHNSRSACETTSIAFKTATQPSSSVSPFYLSIRLHEATKIAT